jgi:CRISPR system Cascade subunit CasA
VLNWLDQRLRFRRRSGAPFEGTALDVSHAFADDPIVAVEAGHPAVELGFEFLLRDILQIAYPPADDAEWAKRLLDPPAPGDLRRALEPHRRAFVLDDPEFPAFQVRPLEADPAPAVPIGLLFADLGNEDAAAAGVAFFEKGGSLSSIHVGLILPVLYQHLVLFPSPAGGYFDPPHRSASIKYQLSAESLWERVWLNVLSVEDPWLASGPWPAPCDGRVYPWLRDDLPRLALGRVNAKTRARCEREGLRVPETVRTFRAGDLHPAVIPLTRRYLLRPSADGVCGLSGRPGPCYSGYERWPQGPQIVPDGWRWWGVAERRVKVREGDGWAPKERSFPGTRGPLRFDDWLHVALGGGTPQPPNSARSVTEVEPPPAIRAFHGRRRHLRGAAEPHGRQGPVAGTTALGAGRGARLPYGVRAVVQFPFGKAVGGTSARELPLYDLPGTAARDLAIVAGRLAEQLGAIAQTLGKRARKAAALGTEGGGEIGSQLEGDLLAAMDAPVIEAVMQLAERYAEGDADDTAVDARLRDLARRTALALFDQAFPVIGGDTPSVKIARVRRELLWDLHRLAPRPHAGTGGEEPAP